MNSLLLTLHEKRESVYDTEHLLLNSGPLPNFVPRSTWRHFEKYVLPTFKLGGMSFIDIRLQYYRWAIRVKLSKFQHFVLAAVYTVVGFYLPVYEISDNIQQTPLHLRQWMLLVSVILAYQTVVFHINRPEFGLLFLLWFGILN